MDGGQGKTKMEEPGKIDGENTEQYKDFHEFFGFELSKECFCTIMKYQSVLTRHKTMQFDERQGTGQGQLFPDPLFSRKVKKPLLFAFKVIKNDEDIFERIC